MKSMECVNETLEQEIESLKAMATNKNDNVDELSNLLSCLKFDDEANGLTDFVTEAHDEKTSTIEADDPAIISYNNDDIDNLCNILHGLKLDDGASSTLEADDPAILQAGEYQYKLLE